MTRLMILALAILLAAEGCGAGSKSSGQQSGAAKASGANTNANNNAPTAGIGGNDTITNLPVYPGATKMPMRANGATYCGHKMALTVYRASGASADQVADWYAGRMNGAIKLDIGNQMGRGSAVTGYTLLDPRGSNAASISQMHFGASAGKMAQSIGADRTTIGLVTYNPPLSPDEMQMMREVTGTDAAAKQRARAQLKSKCGQAMTMSR